MEDVFFGNNKFIGPNTVTRYYGPNKTVIKIIDTLNLKPHSSIFILVECVHGQRQIQWYRRYGPCKKCAIAAGVYNTSPKGRKITWGDKISKAKKGIKASEEHKKAIVEARKIKLCKKIGISLNSFPGFPTKGKHAKIRSFIGNAVRRNIIKRTTQELDLYFKKIIGYTVDELKSHLEAKFQPGMTWGNYGTWHIDHITPDSWFQYSSVEDEGFKKSWALSNLQPLWAKDNISKSNHYSG